MFFAHFFYFCARKGGKMRKIAIFASGEGTNAEQIICYFNARETAEVSLVVASRPTAGVIRRSERLHVPCRVVTPAELEAGKASALLREYDIDFIVLAGFLLKVPDELVAAYPHKIVNIHPSLLPKYGGKGMYGLHVHEAVLAAGDRESGITIHYINGHYDKGVVIFQARCEVLPDDTPESLADRIHQLEYRYYPRLIEELVTVSE